MNPVGSFQAPSGVEAEYFSCTTRTLTSAQGNKMPSKSHTAKERQKRLEKSSAETPLHTAAMLLPFIEKV